MNSNQTIKDWVEACQRHFTECSDVPDLKQLDWFETRRGQFNVWAAGFKATEVGRSSLDYRLRDHSEVRKRICIVLRGLSNTLQVLFRHVTSGFSDTEPILSDNDDDETDDDDDDDGERYDETYDEVDDGVDGEEEDCNWSDLPSDDSPDDSADSEPEEEVDDGPFEGDKFFIEYFLSNLFGITVQIRQSGVGYRQQKADSLLKPGDYEEFRTHLQTIIVIENMRQNSTQAVDYSRLQSLTRDSTTLPKVQTRLINGNILRRNRIIHATRNAKNQPENTENPPPPLQQVIPTGLKVVSTGRLPEAPISARGSVDKSATQANAAQPTPSIRAPSNQTITATRVGSQFNIDTKEPRKLTRSNATRITTIGEVQDYPNCPCPDSGGIVQCPYCANLLDIDYWNNKSRWRGHVARDILPYMCVFEECDTPDMMYITSAQLQQHVSEKHTVKYFRCFPCESKSESKQTFKFLCYNDWELHMHENHSGAFSAHILPRIAELWEQELIPPLDCPLCEFRSEEPQYNLHEHIVNHIHEFALRSLPWDTNGMSLDSEDANSAISPSSDIMSTRSEESDEDTQDLDQEESPTRLCQILESFLDENYANGRLNLNVLDEVKLAHNQFVNLLKGKSKFQEQVTFLSEQISTSARLSNLFPRGQRRKNMDGKLPKYDSKLTSNSLPPRQVLVESLMPRLLNIINILKQATLEWCSDQSTDLIEDDKKDNALEEYKTDVAESASLWLKDEIHILKEMLSKRHHSPNLDVEASESRSVDKLNVESWLRSLTGATASAVEDNSRSPMNETESSYENLENHPISGSLTDEAGQLHDLLSTFVSSADHFLNTAIYSPSDHEFAIEKSCGPGVDESFDRVLVELGAAARHNPKSTIDGLTLWKKRRDTKITQPQRQAIQERSVFSRAYSPKIPDEQKVRSRSTAYILSRALLEVTRRTDMKSISPDVGNSLLRMIYDELTSVDANTLVQSPTRLATWNVYTQSLGALTSKNYEGAMSLFMKRLDSLSVGTALVDASKAEVVLAAMKHTKIVISAAYSHKWNQMDVAETLVDYFQSSKDPSIKSAFCHTLSILLIGRDDRICPSGPDQDIAILNIGQELERGASSKLNWTTTYPLDTALFCLQNNWDFASSWFDRTLSLRPKMNDQKAKPTCLQAISKLLWVHLYRKTRSTDVDTKRLDTIMEMLSPILKNGKTLMDPHISDPLIQIIRAIGFKCPEYCINFIIWPLLDFEMLSANKNIQVEKLDSCRITFGIRSFLHMMSDLEKGDQGQPPFPDYPNLPMLAENYQGTSAASQAFAKLWCTNQNTDLEEVFAHPVQTKALTRKIRHLFERFCQFLKEITLACDKILESDVDWVKYLSERSRLIPEEDGFDLAPDYRLPIQWNQKQDIEWLLRQAIQSMPRCISVRSTRDFFLKFLYCHAGYSERPIGRVSATSIRNIAKNLSPKEVAQGYANYVFELVSHSPSSIDLIFDLERALNILQTYSELLEIWIKDMKRLTRDSKEGNPSLGTRLDLTIDDINQIDAHGLFSLSSDIPTVRRWAIRIFGIASELDHVLKDYNPTSIHRPQLTDLLEQELCQFGCLGERSLETQLSSKRSISEVCISDEPADMQLWNKIYPSLIQDAAKNYPATAIFNQSQIDGLSSNEGFT